MIHGVCSLAYLLLCCFFLLLLCFAYFLHSRLQRCCCRCWPFCEFTFWDCSFIICLCIFYFIVRRRSRQIGIGPFFYNLYVCIVRLYLFRFWCLFIFRFPPSLSHSLNLSLAAFAVLCFSFGVTLFFVSFFFSLILFIIHIFKIFCCLLLAICCFFSNVFIQHV